MIRNPETGMQCWIVVDIWETLCPAPVTIVEKSKEADAFLCCWMIAENHCEYYEEVWPENLYETEREAWQAIRTERRIENAQKRNGIFGGEDYGRSELS